ASLASKESFETKATPRVYLKTYGLYGWDCGRPKTVPIQLGLPKEEQPSSWSVRDELDWDYCGPTLRYAPIKQHKTPDLSSYIYSPQATQVLDAKDNAVATYLDLSEGQAVFELVYRSGRYAPYLELEAFTDLAQTIYTRKIVPFQDQLGDQVDISDSAWQQGKIKYQTSFSAEKLTPDQDQLITVDITAQDAATGLVHDANYQRVRVWAYPLAYYAQYQQPPFRPFVITSLRKGILEAPGEFVIPNMGTGNESQQILYKGAKYIETDLIDGGASVQFKYNGKYRLNNQLVFIVQPANYYYAYTFDQLGMSAFEQDSVNPYIHREYNTTEISSRALASLPDQPDLPKLLKEADLLGDWKSKYNFLYEQWMDSDAISSGVYTVSILPIDVPTAGTGRTFAGFSVNHRYSTWWIISLATTLLVLSGVWLIWLRRRKMRVQLARPTCQSNKLLRRLKPTGKLVVYTGLAIVVMVAMVAPLSQSAELPLPGLQDSTPPPNQQQAGADSGYRLDITFEDGKLNPRVEGVSRGTVRVLDKNGKQLPVEGGVLLAQGVLNFNLLSGTKKLLDFHDNYGEIRGTESVRSSTLKAAVIEAIQKPDTEEANWWVEQVEADARDIVGANFGKQRADSIINQLREGFTENYTELVETTPAVNIWEPGCAKSGFGGTTNCSQILILHNGEASFEYINHGYPTSRYISFSAVADEVKTSDLALYDTIDYQSYDPDNYRSGSSADLAYKLGMPFGLLDRGIDSLTDPRSFTWATLPGALNVAKSFPFGDYNQFTSPQLTSSTQTLLGYYYQIKPSLRRIRPIAGQRFQLTIEPKLLPGYTLPVDIQNQATLRILPGYDPDDKNENAVGTKTYPAGFMSAESAGLSYEAQFKIGAQPVTLNLEATGEPSAIPYLRFELEVVSAAGYPDYLKFEDIITEAAAHPGSQRSASIRRDLSPTTMQASLVIPLQSDTWWTALRGHDAFRVGWWQLANQALQLIFGGMILLMLRRKFIKKLK
ncbi:MAG: hypothetical protein V1826_01365, partial [bacterium]